MIMRALARFVKKLRSIKHRFNTAGSDFSFCGAPGAKARIDCISDYPPHFYEQGIHDENSKQTTFGCRGCHGPGFWVCIVPN